MSGNNGLLYKKERWKMTKLHIDKSIYKIQETTIEDFFQGKTRERFEQSICELREKNRQMVQKKTLGHEINIRIIF